VAPKTPAPDPAATAAAGGGAPRLGLGDDPLVVLTGNPHLLATLRRVTDPSHQVLRVAIEVDLSTALVAQHAGVAVLDCAATATPIAQLTDRLHAQFPDVVLIVAGNADEQGLLATQITSGCVHRFLHKPVSEQRVRLFVEAAWRRHAAGGDGPAVGAAAPPARRGGSRWGLALVAVALAATPVLLWVNNRTPQEAPQATAAGSASPRSRTDTTLEDLLSRADQALAAGQLVTPRGSSAADLYHEALRRDAGDPRAVNGLEEVIGRLLASAEQQLQQHDLDAAQQLADQARGVSPNHPRVAFLEAQIGAQRERAVLGKAQRDAASGDVAGALRTLDDATHTGQHSTLVDEARQELAQKQVDARVAEYLGRSRNAMARAHLIDPLEDNARFYIESARALAPSDPAVQQALQDLATRLESEARRALSARNDAQADIFAQAAQDAGADPTRIDALHADARHLRSAARAESLAQLASAFNQRLEQGHIVDPATDSARYYLAQLTQTDADNAATQLARGAYRTRLLDEARNALKAQDFSGTRRWLTEARTAGAESADVALIDTALGAAQAEADQANMYVNESALTRTRYVAPQFPDVARQRGIDGWVDMQFLVGMDGGVSDVKVVGAQPAGVFEQAALEALRHWHYQPVVHNGHPVSQRARVRVRFAVQR
jgi:protein TonB